MNCKNKKQLYIIMALIAGLVSSMPLLLKGIDGAPHQDLAFHLSRIEGIKEGLLAGKFPVMMQSVWMNGKGYPVSIFYGDALLYFPALLRIVGIPVIASYKIFVLIINILTALVAFFCFKDLFKSENGALLGAFLYVTSSYRLLDIFVRNATGEYCAFLFFPIVAMAMGRILSENTGEKKDYLKNSLWLCLGMTGLLETHLLSTVMTVFLLVILCIFYFKRTFRPNTLLCIALAVLETILLNLYYLVPFIDYYMSEPIYGGKGVDHSAAMQIREYGAFLSQYFSFFESPFGVNAYDLERRMQLTIGLALMTSVLICFLYFVIKDRKYKTFVLGFLSVLCLWMSTNLFPWNSLEGYTKLFKFLSNVQFPWRYLAPASLFVSLLVVLIFKKASEGKGKNVTYAVAGLLALMAIATTLVFTLRYKEGYSMVNYVDYSEVDSGYMGACEYLKNNVSLENLSYVPENSGFIKCVEKYTKDNTVVFDVVNGEEENNLEVLKLNYTGYVAFDSKGNNLQIFDGFNDLITVIVPAGFDDTVTVTFKQPYYWVISEIISCMSLAAILLYLVKTCRKKSINY